MAKFTPAPQGTALPRIVEALLPRKSELVVRSLRRIRTEIALYRDTDLITDDDLHRSVTSNIDYIIGNIVDGGTLDLRAPEQTGRARASTSVPLADVLAAYRLTFSLIWTQCHVA